MWKPISGILIDAQPAGLKFKFRTEDGKWYVVVVTDPSSLVLKVRAGGGLLGAEMVAATTVNHYISGPDRHGSRSSFGFTLPPSAGTQQTVLTGFVEEVYLWEDEEQTGV